MSEASRDKIRPPESRWNNDKTTNLTASPKRRSRRENQHLPRLGAPHEYRCLGKCDGLKQRRVYTKIGFILFLGITGKIQITFKIKTSAFLLAVTLGGGKKLNIIVLTEAKGTVSSRLTWLLPPLSLICYVHGSHTLFLRESPDCIEHHICPSSSFILS